MAERFGSSVTLEVDAYFDDLCDAETSGEWSAVGSVLHDARDARCAAEEALLEFACC